MSGKYIQIKKRTKWNIKMFCCEILSIDCISVYKWIDYIIIMDILWEQTGSKTNVLIISIFWMYFTAAFFYLHFYSVFYV